GAGTRRDAVVRGGLGLHGLATDLLQPRLPAGIPFDAPPVLLPPERGGDPDRLRLRHLQRGSGVQRRAGEDPRLRGTPAVRGSPERRLPPRFGAWTRVSPSLSSA